MKTKSLRRLLSRSAITVLALGLLHAFLATDALAADSLVDKSKAVASDATEAVKDAGRSVADRAEQVWKRIDEGMLKNRKRDEVVAWVIMGVLVGAVAGMMTPLKPTGIGKLGRLLLGLAGAFLGGIIAHVVRADFGLGPVLIRYEELLFSLLGAVVLVVISKLLSGKAKKQPAAK